jgi:hypothetical protein
VDRRPWSELPQPPFDRWPRPAFHVDYGFAWYSSAQRALITQTTVSRARREGGLVLCDWIDAALREDAAAIDAAGGTFLLHDFRSLDGYDTETRMVINERIKLRKADTHGGRSWWCVRRRCGAWRCALQI